MNAERRDDRVLLLLQICCFSFVLLFVDATHANLGETTFTVQTTARVSGDVRERWDGDGRLVLEERQRRGPQVSGVTWWRARERGGAGSEGHVASPAQPWAAENQPTNQPTGRPSERSVFQALNMFVMENAKNPFIHIITLLFVVIPPKFVPHALREGLLYQIG